MALLIGVFPTLFLGKITPDSRPVLQKLNEAQDRMADAMLESRTPAADSFVAVALQSIAGGGK